MDLVKNKIGYVHFQYDFAKDGGAVGFIDLSAKANRAGLPVGSVVKSVMTHVLTAFTSGGSATVSVGDVASTARYKALTAFDNAGYAANAPAALSTALPNHVATADEGKIGIAIAVAALTAGKMDLYVEYYNPAYDA